MRKESLQEKVRVELFLIYRSAYAVEQGVDPQQFLNFFVQVPIERPLVDVLDYLIPVCVNHGRVEADIRKWLLECTQISVFKNTSKDGKSMDVRFWSPVCETDGNCESRNQALGNRRVEPLGW